jgi:glycosyltransferase involved in cell wall biosynthesis
VGDRRSTRAKDVPKNPHIRRPIDTRRQYLSYSFDAFTMSSRLPAHTRSPAEVVPSPSRCASRPPTSTTHFCVVTETFAPEINGVALTLRRLVEGLRQAGHVVSVVRPRQVSDSTTTLARSAGLDRKVRGSTVLVRGLPVPGYRGVQMGLPATGRLLAAWTAHRPDAIYVATEGPLGWSAVRAARRLRIPVFSGFHTNFHRYADFYGASWLRAALERYLRHLHNATDATIVASQGMRAIVGAMGISPVRVLERGVDCARFSPAHRSTELRRHWGATDDDVVVAHVGRIAAEKNVGLALEAYRAVRRGVAHARCIVVGDGPVRATLERQHRDVVFCGVRTGHDLAAHYASADIFLFPSETDTFGNVVLEAMASGLAVVAFDYAAAGRHIRSDENGVLVALGDHDAYIRRAVQVVARAGTLADMRREARATMLPLEWSAVVSRFSDVLSGGRDEAGAGAPVAEAPWEATA